MKRGLSTYIIFILLLAAGNWQLARCGYAQPLSLQTEKPPRAHIRVAIIQDASSLSVRVKGSYEIADALTGTVLSSGENLSAVIVAYGEGILIGSLPCSTAKVFIKAGKEDPFIIDGRQFRGNIQINKKDDLRLLVINYIELEDYIKGVLYHEASHYWPMEALKAQAIACRTFALYQAQENASREYDVTADIYSQVYGGRTSERYRTTLAVNETAGKVLMYNGRILPAYYHSSCGGKTEDAALIWQIDMLPLKGVRCGFCNDSPQFNWHKVIGRDTLQAKLKEAGNDVGSLTDIAINGRDESSRATTLKIIGDKKEIEISSKDLRNIVGPNTIRSTNFDVSLVEGDLVFQGFGWGHGVGMCQWGAYFMAKQGYKYGQILNYYYPGAEVASR